MNSYGEFDFDYADDHEDEIDHDFTNEITCPYCGNEIGDSWEYSEKGELDCKKCNGKFKYFRDVEITYCTQKME